MYVFGCSYHSFLTDGPETSDEELTSHLSWLTWNRIRKEGNMLWSFVMERAGWTFDKHVVLRLEYHHLVVLVPLILSSEKQAWKSLCSQVRCLLTSFLPNSDFKESCISLLFFFGKTYHLEIPLRLPLSYLTSMKLVKIKTHYLFVIYPLLSFCNDMILGKKEGE